MLVVDDRIEIGMVIHGCRERAEPLVPVKSSGDLHLGKVARDGSCGIRVHIVTADIDLDFLDLAEISLTGVGSGEDELVAGALLATDLEDPVVFTDSLDKLLAFIDGEGHRFLKIHILSGLAGGDRYDGVLMVRGSDNDSVDIRTSENILIVLIDINLNLLLSLALIVISDPLDETVSLDIIHITTGDNSHITH